jgi:hypothetical protein
MINDILFQSEAQVLIKLFNIKVNAYCHVDEFIYI